MIRKKRIHIKTAKGRKVSSTRWLDRQINDPYITLAKQDGYRSRSAYKLLEIEQKFSLFNQGDIVIDLGSSPGGWSQVASKKCNKVIAIDILPMKTIPNVQFVQGDFTSLICTIKVMLTIKGANVILSDISPPTCGHTPTDHIRIIMLGYEIIKLAKETLQDKGHLVIKIFQGNEAHNLYSDLKPHFQCVKYYKPKASRQDSSEMYLVATNFSG